MKEVDRLKKIEVEYLKLKTNLTDKGSLINESSYIKENKEQRV